MSVEPEVLSNGSLNTRWLRTLDRSEMRRWVSDVIQGRTDVPDADPDAPHYLVLEAYDGADADLRDLMRSVVRDLVCEMADDPASEWRKVEGDDSPGARLLCVAGSMRDSDLVGPIRGMIESQALLRPDACVFTDMHGRLLQALVKLGVREDQGFWRAQLGLAPNRYLGVALRGRALDRDANPFALLWAAAPLPWDDRMQATVERFVDVMTNERGTVWVTQRASEYATLMPSSLAERLGLREPTANSPWDSAPARLAMVA